MLLQWPRRPRLAAGVCHGHARHAGTGGEVRAGSRTGLSWWCGSRLGSVRPGPGPGPPAVHPPTSRSERTHPGTSRKLPVSSSCRAASEIPRRPQRGVSSVIPWLGLAVHPDGPVSPRATERALPSWRLSPEQGPLPSCPARPGTVLRNPRVRPSAPPLYPHVPCSPSGATCPASNCVWALDLSQRL